jgi:hypothetical protein
MCDIMSVVSRHASQIVTMKASDSVQFCKSLQILKVQTNSLALSPRENYTDWATATCPRNLVPTFVDWGVSRGQRSGSLTVVNLSFLEVHGFKNRKTIILTISPLRISDSLRPVVLIVANMKIMQMYPLLRRVVW